MLILADQKDICIEGARGNTCFECGCGLILIQQKYYDSIKAIVDEFKLQRQNFLDDHDGSPTFDQEEEFDNKYYYAAIQKEQDLYDKIRKTGFLPYTRRLNSVINIDNAHLEELKITDTVG